MVSQQVSFVERLSLSQRVPYRRFHCIPVDIALLVMDKCTKEKNDRDDVSFQMSFDYEFVEDFYVERPAEDNTTPPPIGGVANVRFSGSGRGSWVGVPGKREEGEVVELRDVTVLEDGKTEKEEESGVKGVAQSDEDGYVVITGVPPPLSVTISRDKLMSLLCDVSLVLFREDEWKPREYDKQNHVLSIMVGHHHSI